MRLSWLWNSRFILCGVEQLRFELCVLLVRRSLFGTIRDPHQPAVLGAQSHEFPFFDIVAFFMEDLEHVALTVVGFPELFDSIHQILIPEGWLALRRKSPSLELGLKGTLGGSKVRVVFHVLHNLLEGLTRVSQWTADAGPAQVLTHLAVLDVELVADIFVGFPVVDLFTVRWCQQQDSMGHEP